MKETKNMFQSAGETVEYARQYIEQQGELLRLEAAERLAKVTSAFITFLVLALLGMLVLALLSVAVALWLGKILESYALAFLIVAAVYALLGVLMYVFRTRLITNPALGAVLDSFFDKEENER
jgi:hypothetical protein